MAVRTGPALALPSGSAQSDCERADWYEPAPAGLDAQAQTAGITFNMVHLQHFDGIALFKPGERKAQELEDVWPKLNEPKLQRLHEARIEPVDAAAYRSLYWALAGMGGMIAGFGGAAATANSSNDVAIGFAVAGLAAGAVGVIGALVAQPSGADQLQAEARRQLFIPGEDDIAAVGRGVDRSNANARARCRGRRAAATVPAASVPARSTPVPNTPSQSAPSVPAPSIPAPSEPTWSDPAPASTVLVR